MVPGQCQQPSARARLQQSAEDTASQLVHCIPCIPTPPTCAATECSQSDSTRMCAPRRCNDGAGGHVCVDYGWHRSDVEYSCADGCHGTCATWQTASTYRPVEPRHPQSRAP
eukprot:220330-Pyramimonas_sp.AAC.1